MILFKMSDLSEGKVALKIPLLNISAQTQNTTFFYNILAVL